MSNPNDALPTTFFTAPGSSTTMTTMTIAKLRALLLYNGGYIFACGDLWDIKSKSLGAGVYQVWLKKWDALPR